MKSNSHEYTFSPNREESDDSVHFPVLKKIITLNDLAPSTQKEITFSPVSLPPRTPKPKHNKNDKVIQ
jgi:hypothetical protein